MFYLISTKGFIYRLRRSHLKIWQSYCSKQDSDWERP